MFLRKCHTRLFKTPPKEWIEDRVSTTEDVSELKTEGSALLLRKLPGRIVAEPMERADGLRHLQAKTRLLCPAPPVEEPAAHPPPALAGSVAPGSTAFGWRAIPDEDGHTWEETLSF